MANPCDISADIVRWPIFCSSIFVDNRVNIPRVRETVVLAIIIKSTWDGSSQHFYLGLQYDDLRSFRLPRSGCIVNSLEYSARRQSPSGIDCLNIVLPSLMIKAIFY